MSKRAGKIDKGFLTRVNKKLGRKALYNLNDEEDPTVIPYWVPTGSRWLDSIVARGKVTGIPGGRITEIAGLEGTGKSWMALKIAVNAQKMGMPVLWIDSEASFDKEYATPMGVDFEQEDFFYVRGLSVEETLETVEEFLKQGVQSLVVWDSLAQTPCDAEIEKDYNPNSDIARKARVLSLGMKKLTVPVSETQSTFVVLNQLKTNITSNMYEAMATPYVTPGGKSLDYSYSLRIWLTKRKSKKTHVNDERGFKTGYEVKCTLKKSRFGGENRVCSFNLIFAGENTGIEDEVSWLEALRGSNSIRTAGAWSTLTYADGSEEKFQKANWVKKIKENEKFKNRILELMDEEVVLKFENAVSGGAEFYSLPEDQH